MLRKTHKTDWTRNRLLQCFSGVPNRFISCKYFSPSLSVRHLSVSHIEKSLKQVKVDKLLNVPLTSQISLRLYWEPWLGTPITEVKFFFFFSYLGSGQMECMSEQWKQNNGRKKLGNDCLKKNNLPNLPYLTLPVPYLFCPSGPWVGGWLMLKLSHVFIWRLLFSLRK